VSGWGDGGGNGGIGVGAVLLLAGVWIVAQVTKGDLISHLITGDSVSAPTPSTTPAPQLSPAGYPTPTQTPQPLPPKGGHDHI
jgi:hypothetical protein